MLLEYLWKNNVEYLPIDTYIYIYCGLFCWIHVGKYSMEHMGMVNFRVDQMIIDELFGVYPRQQEIST